ncbi:MAG: DUF2330 domain-containing protein [Planctomycetes bacterium]|nr:DUF2330 domain-containing protein [Planctomycetota bacterium]
MRALAGLLPLALGALPAAARADGKFYVRDEVPLGEPYQRALLAWKDGKELLCVQPQLLGKAEEFAWVVPVPAVPEMGSMEAGHADELFFHLGWIAVPDAVRFGPWVYLPSLGALMIALLFCRRLQIKHRICLVFLVFCLGLILPVFLYPRLLSRGLGSEDAGDGITVLAHEKLGIYETKVVRSERPGAMKGWLAANGYRSGPEDDAAIADYERRGWCFVASRIRVQAAEVQALDGMIEALVLHFAAPEPVYPFALTATSGRPTEVVLYAFADRKLAHPALRTRFAGPAPFERFSPRRYTDLEDRLDERSRPAPPTLAGSPGFLTKLSGRLSKGNAPGDLVLSQAPDGSAYRETVYRW